MSQDTPLHRFDAQQRLEDIADFPTRGELLQMHWNGELTLDQWAAEMNHWYPMSVEEAAAARARPYVPLWSAIIARREAERDAAEKDGLE